MKRYAVIQHTYSEFLGQIESQLEKREIGFTYYRTVVGDALPASALHFDALFILGGAYPTADRENCPFVADEMQLINAYQKAKRPVVGLGFGGLVVAEHAGGTPSMEPYHNAYWTTAHITEAGKGDSVAEAVDGQEVFVMHNGSVQLPDDVEPILVDDEGKWIAIRPHELTYGFLFRPEMKPGMLEDMIMEDDRETPDNIGELMETARNKWQAMQDQTDHVVVAMVNELDMMQERRKAPVFSLKVE